MARFTSSAQTERSGINHIAAISAKMGYIWRETPNSDVGFDGEIEIVIGDQATGQIIKVQSRAGKSYIRNEKPERFDFYADANELEYWQGATNPVILVVYNPKTKSAHWIDVKKYISTHRDVIKSRPHKIVFDKKSCQLSATSAKALLELFERGHKDFEEPYRKHIIERFSKLTLYSVTSDAPVAVDLERIFVTLTAMREDAKSGIWSALPLELLSRFVQLGDANTVIGRVSRPMPQSLPVYGTPRKVRKGRIKSDIDVGRSRRIAFLADFRATRDLIVTPTSSRYDLFIDSVSINSALKSTLFLVITGGAGAGKTTLLKYLALAFARHKGEEKLELEESRLPIFIALRDFSRFLDSVAQRGELIEIGPHLLLQFITENLKIIAPHLEAPDTFFPQKLEVGECIVLLDGLDEVADPLKRARVAECVAVFAAHHQENRFVI